MEYQVSKSALWRPFVAVVPAGYRDKAGISITWLYFAMGLFCHTGALQRTGVRRTKKMMPATHPINGGCLHHSRYRTTQRLSSLSSCRLATACEHYITPYSSNKQLQIRVTPHIFVATSEWLYGRLCFCARCFAWAFVKCSVFFTGIFSLWFGSSFFFLLMSYTKNPVIHTAYYTGCMGF